VKVEIAGSYLAHPRLKKRSVVSIKIEPESPAEKAVLILLRKAKLNVSTNDDYTWLDFRN
jgi:hypothetical protein